MLKRVTFALLLVVLATAVAGTAMAAGRFTRPVASSAGIRWSGGGGRALPRLTSTLQKTTALRLAEFEFPSFDSPVNRYDWSRWFGWLQRID